MLPQGYKISRKCVSWAGKNQSILNTNALISHIEWWNPLEIISSWWLSYKTLRLLSCLYLRYTVHLHYRSLTPSSAPSSRIFIWSLICLLLDFHKIILDQRYILSGRETWRLHLGKINFAILKTGPMWPMLNFGGLLRTGSTYTTETYLYYNYSIK